MKKILSIGLLLSLLFVLTGCNSDKSKIKKAATSFFSALNHKNIISAKLYATKESGDFLGIMQQQLQETNDTTAASDEKFLINDIKINGNNATASIRSASQPTPLHITLKKEGNDWKVAFDKNTIMGMMSEMGIQNLPKTGDVAPPTGDSQPSMLNNVEPARRDTQVLQLPQ